MKIQTELTPQQIAAAWRNPDVAKAWPVHLRVQLPVNPAGTNPGGEEIAALLDSGMAADRRGNGHTVRCSTWNCFSQNCASMLCPTSRAHCR